MVKAEPESRSLLSQPAMAGRIGALASGGRRFGPTMLVLVMLLGVLPGMVFAGDGAIGDRPGTQRFGLENGLEVVMVPTGSLQRPAQRGGDRVQVWLVLGSGSVDELGDERGAAMVFEKVIRNGATGQTPEQIDLMLGVNAGEDTGNEALPGSIAGFDQMVFTGGFVGGDLRGMESLLEFYAHLLDPGGLTLDQSQFERAIEDVRGEIDAKLTPDMRARQQWLPELLGPSLLSDRLRLPESEQLDSLRVDALERFARRCMVPSRALLLVVGDLGAAGEPKRIETAIARAFSGIGPPEGHGQESSRRDVRLGFSISGRCVLGADPDLSGDQAALIWATDRREVSRSSRPGRCEAFDEQQMRALLIDRVAVEAVRHRLGRLSTASMGAGAEVSVEQIELMGQIDLMQAVIEGDDGMSGQWERLLRVLVGECDRLARDGVSDEELRRARASLLARWHRQADGWDGESSGEKAWMIHWLVSSGKPVIGMTRWDRYATELLSTISDEQINHRLRGLIESEGSAALVVTRGDGSLAADKEASDRVRGVVDSVRSSPLSVIDEDWMRSLGGELLDRVPQSGTIIELTQHRDSGVWGGRLSSGARVWVRPMGGSEGRVELCATISGPWLGHESMSEELIDAAMQAWSKPSSEHRSRAWLAVYMRDHGIRIEPRRVVGGVQLRIGVDHDELDSAIELLYLLLDRPMIESEGFESWAAQGRGGSGDVLDRGLEMLYRGGGERRDQPITIDDAQRTLTRIVRNGSIEVGIAGDLDPEHVLERCGALLGSLVKRPAPGTGVGDEDHRPAATLRERAVMVDSDDPKEQGIAIGLVGGSMSDLDRLRATVLGAMVLGQHSEALAQERGIGMRLRSQVIMAEALGEHWALMMRGYGDPAEAAVAGAIFEESAARLLHDGVDQDELKQMQDRLVESIGRYFETPGYWSARLSTLGMHGRSVDDLWDIREGYAGITPEQVNAALRSALNGMDRFRVTITD